MTQSRRQSTETSLLKLVLSPDISSDSLSSKSRPTRT